MKNLNSILNDFKVNSKKADLTYVIGVVTLIIYSKEAFKRNKDIEPFLNDVFNISFLSYVFKSRTLICARVGRNLSEIDEMELEIIKKNMLKYFHENLDQIQNKTVIQKKKRKKKNANDKLDTWLKGF